MQQTRPQLRACVAGLEGESEGGGLRNRVGPLTVPCLQHVHSSLAAFAPSIPFPPSLPPKPTPKKCVTQFGPIQPVNEPHLY